MNCEECKKLLSDYLDDAASQPEELREHVAACAECAAELERLLKLDRMVRDRGTPSPGEAVRRETLDRVRAVVRAQQARPSARVIVFPRRAWVAVAAAVMLASAIGLLSLRKERAPMADVEAPIAEADMVERLASASLALSETKAPAERAEIFNRMAACFYEDFVGAARIGDAEEAGFSASNFEKLIRDGVIANAQQTAAHKDKADLSALQSALAGYAAGARALAAKSPKEISATAERLVAAAQDAERTLRGI